MSGRLALRCITNPVLHRCAQVDSALMLPKFGHPFPDLPNKKGGHCAPLPVDSKALVKDS